MHRRSGEHCGSNEILDFYVVSRNGCHEVEFQKAFDVGIGNDAKGKEMISQMSHRQDIIQCKDAAGGSGFGQGFCGVTDMSSPS